MLFIAILVGAQLKRDNVENKPASLLAVSLEKTLNEMPHLHAAVCLGGGVACLGSGTKQFTHRRGPV